MIEGFTVGSLSTLYLARVDVGSGLLGICYQRLLMLMLIKVLVTVKVKV
jgi:hypothetical protein